MKIFNAFQNFFDSIGEYIENFSYLFLIFIAAFAVLSIIIAIVTSFAYECMLTKTIDKINRFLERNPRINDDNLVAFNNLMKGRRVPKILRRQWQQFMLYREHPVSYYMSFKHCVENPMRNSTYRQQMTIYKIISYILVVLSLIVSVFMARQSVNANFVLQDVVIVPVSLLIAYWVVSMVLDLIHNATTGDLFQNYQYFEINMDKAMVTLPEFVDYEVLFSQEEIRKGIPVLFAYLQKRAVQEQQELEKARLKNVDHEKFDFDKAGLDGSLVLDRAMRETESFSSQRKSYLQEIERVNNEMSALETNYKEQVKEYQRQVQTSKETVENLKSQLEQAASTIEINYIKKQIRDEINRQQLAEKDFDTTTDKYNQELRNLKQEVKKYDEETDKAKEALEASMLSEFNTYSIKVYNNLEKIVEEKMQERLNGDRNQIKELEEQLENRNEELDNVYARYQEVLSQTPANEMTYQEEPQGKGKKKKGKNKGEDTFEDVGVQAYDQSFEQQQYAPTDVEYVDNYEQNGEYVEGGDNYTQEYTQDYNSDGYSQDYGTGEYGQDQYQEYNPAENAYANQDVNYGYQSESEGMAIQYQDELNDGENYPQGEYYQETPSYQMQDQEYIPGDQFNGEYSAVDAENNGYNYDYTNSDQVENSQLNENVDMYGEAPTNSVDGFIDGEYRMQDDDQVDQISSANFNENEFNIDFEDNDGSYNHSVDDDIFGQYAVQSKQDVVDEDPVSKEIEAPAENVNEPAKDSNEADFDIDKVLDLDNLEDVADDKQTLEDDGEQESKTETEQDPKADNKQDFEVEDEDADGQDVIDGEGETSYDEEDESGYEDEEGYDEEDEADYEEEEDELPAPSTIKRKAGRPRKIVDDEEIKPKRKPGRPRKVVDDEEIKPKRKAGRPRKSTSDSDNKSKRKPGRPKKEEAKRPVGRPKKTRGPGRPRKNEESSTSKPKRKVGRPRKNS